MTDGLKNMIFLMFRLLSISLRNRGKTPSCFYIYLYNIETIRKIFSNILKLFKLFNYEKEIITKHFSPCRLADRGVRSEQEHEQLW